MLYLLMCAANESLSLGSTHRTDELIPNTEGETKEEDKKKPTKLLPGLLSGKKEPVVLPGILSRTLEYVKRI